MEDSATNEESVPEVAENEDRGNGGQNNWRNQLQKTKQEDNVANNESEPEEQNKTNQKKRNPIAQALRTPKYSQKKMEKQETVQRKREVDSEDGIATDVAKIESKVNKNLKNVAKQIAKIVKQNTKNLTKEELFFKNNNGLSAYADQNFINQKYL